MAKAKPPADDKPPQRRNWAAAVSGDTSVLGAAAFARAGFSDPTLVLAWEKIAGPEVARMTRPLRLSEGVHGGVLTLIAEPGAAVFLQHETRVLAERINTYLGRPAVARLKFVQASLTQREPPPQRFQAAAEIAPTDPVLGYQGPDELREALWRLARARHSRGIK